MANLIYINEETPVTWSDTGGTAVMDLGGLVGDAVRVGARHDFTDIARSEWYEWRVNIDGFNAAPVVGERVDFYLSTSDGTFEDGDVGTADAAGVLVALPNLIFLGSAVVQVATAANELHASGHVRITARYVSPVVHNNTVTTFLSTADSHQFILTPVPAEIQ